MLPEFESLLKEANNNGLVPLGWHISGKSKESPFESIFEIPITKWRGDQTKVGVDGLLVMSKGVTFILEPIT